VINSASDLDKFINPFTEEKQALSSSADLTLLMLKDSVAEAIPIFLAVS